MIIILAVFGFVVLLFIGGRVNISIQLNNEVKVLFAQSKDISKKKFSYRQLDGLSAPVQRYFKHILKDGQPYISYVRFTHGGQFKAGLDKKWVNIKGEQYVTTEKPGFIWKGRTAMFIARDMYIADKGRLIVSLFSFYKIVDGKGKIYDQGELIRWLGESILYPTNLLPGKRLQWSAIDAVSAKLTFNYLNLQLFYIVTFNDTGEIIQLETKRYMDEDNLETWIIKLAGYKKINEIVVPTVFEVLWRLKNGDVSYVKFNVQKIDYNIPGRF